MDIGQEIDINRWIIMIIEHYCSHIGKKSSEVYPIFVEKHVLDVLENGYDLLHSMSIDYMNDYIGDLLAG